MNLRTNVRFWPGALLLIMLTSGCVDEVPADTPIEDEDGAVYDRFWFLNDIQCNQPFRTVSVLEWTPSSGSGVLDQGSEGFATAANVTALVFELPGVENVTTAWISFIVETTDGSSAYEYDNRLGPTLPFKTIKSPGEESYVFSWDIKGVPNAAFSFQATEWYCEDLRT